MRDQRFLRCSIGIKNDNDNDILIILRDLIETTRLYFSILSIHGHITTHFCCAMSLSFHDNCANLFFFSLSCSSTTLAAGTDPPDVFEEDDGDGNHDGGDTTQQGGDPMALNMYVSLSCDRILLAGVYYVL